MPSISDPIKLYDDNLIFMVVAHYSFEPGSLPSPRLASGISSPRRSARGGTSSDCQSDRGAATRAGDKTGRIECGSFMKLDSALNRRIETPKHAATNATREAVGSTVADPDGAFQE